MFSLQDNAIATHADFFGDETELDMSNITTTYTVPSTPNTRIHKDHSLDHVIGDIQSGVLTRRMTKTTNEQRFISVVYEGKTYKDLHTCLFACFLSQEEPKKVIHALKDPSWIEAMQKELLQFKIQQVWTLVDLPLSKRAIGTKWVYRNKKDERGIVIRNKARLVAHGYTQEEGIYYDEMFALVPRIEAIRISICKIEEELYDLQPPGFEETRFPGRQDKYVDEILKKFGFSTMKIASTPMETSKPLLKDAKPEDDDVHLYRSMIGSFTYLTSSRPEIMFAVYSSFDLEAYSDSDYASASLDRKSTTGGCQFLGSRLISWKCKKQTIVANSTTEVEYVAAASCCGQLWATAKANTVNGEVQIQALVDGKKVIDKCMDKSKNHKKTIKSEQARTRESEEYKAEAPKAKPQPIPLSLSSHNKPQGPILQFLESYL
ncbi:putative reverse transcriptase, RNA-dependent DNA polymerase [Tanacetum coccineum]